MVSYTLFFTFALLFSPSLAGSVQKGGACNQKNNKLVPGSYQFHSDCDSVTFCNSTNLCQLKGCRRDIFPFGYSESSHLPDLCPNGQFCPDEEDACQPLIPVGQPCQLNRDDQCAPPPNFQQLANPRFGMNVNGSVCLNFQCYWANVTAGQTCVVENTGYTGYGADGQEFIDIVSRGNCMPGLYCDSQVLQCKQTLALGQSCSADKQCDSMNCLSTQVCGAPADAPKHFPIFVYIVVCIGIFGGIFGTLIGLFFVHRRQRDTEREKRMQYWREQNAFRQNIMHLRETARASMLSLPLGANGNGTESNRSTLYGRDFGASDESQLPILANAASAPRGSGLRHNRNFSDGGSDMEDYQFVTERENDMKKRSARAF